MCFDGLSTKLGNGINLCVAQYLLEFSSSTDNACFVQDA
jgi:hypothetical protein